MKEFVAKLLSNEVVEAKELFIQRIDTLVNEKLNQVKMRFAVEIYPDVEIE